jgi:Domain of unknown function (DUF5668)/Cell wall-active antibiotics response 4TMS YvqF/N-terminal domain of toast_rack, DUF2154
MKMTDTMQTSEGRRRHGGVVGPVILIGAGIVILLANLGRLNWDVLGTLFRLWPVLLIAIGLDILIGRRSAIASVLIALLLLGVLGWVILAGGVAPVTGTLLPSETVSLPLEGAARGEISISSGVGELRISPADEGANLIEGQVVLAQGEQAIVNHNRSNDTLSFSLRSQGTPSVWWPGFRDHSKIWDLKLNPDVPLTLELNGGVGDVTVDLQRTKLTSLTAKGGIGNGTFTLPRQGRVSATINGGIGNLTVIIPAGMAAHVHVNSGLGQVAVTGSFQYQDNDYTSPGYDSATDRVDVQVDGGIGNVTVRATNES